MPTGSLCWALERAQANGALIKSVSVHIVTTAARGAWVLCVCICVCMNMFVCVHAKYVQHKYGL